MSIRGLFTITGRTFAVSGPAFVEVMQNGTTTYHGAVANDSLPVTMAASPQQLLLASGGVAYVFDLAANTLSAIPGATFSGPVAQAGICDDFFIVTIRASKEFYVSGALDANDWTTNGSAIVSVFPDNIVSFIVSHRELWFFSDTKTVVYYDSGNIFPFDVIAGSDMDQGCAAEFSAALLSNTVFWLGADERGHGVVWAANGYTPQRISNHAIELAIQSYDRIDDVVALTMQDQGHYFYQLYFPTPSKTWTYDTITGMWHQRGYYLPANGDFQAAHYQNHTFNWNKHLGGDWSSDNIYEIHIPILTKSGMWQFATDDDNPIVRRRRSPHISKEQKFQFHNELQVYVEPGLGGMPPLTNAQQPTYLVLQDSSATVWQVGASDIGILTTQAIPGAPQQLFLNDANNSTSWRLGINTLGVLTTTQVGLDPTFPKEYDLVSPGLLVWAIKVTNLGVLQTWFEGNYFPARGPQMNLRWSNDSTKTWSNSYTRDCGQMGEYQKRVRWLRLGRARDRVYEVQVSDPIAWRIVDAYLNVQDGTGV